MYIDILRLARAVNLDIDQELQRLKDKVRAGLKELEQKGYLDQCQITKANRALNTSIWEKRCIIEFCTQKPLKIVQERSFYPVSMINT